METNLIFSTQVPFMYVTSENCTACVIDDGNSKYRPKESGTVGGPFIENMDTSLSHFQYEKRNVNEFQTSSSIYSDLVKNYFKETSYNLMNEVNLRFLAINKVSVDG